MQCIHDLIRPTGQPQQGHGRRGQNWSWLRWHVHSLRHKPTCVPVAADHCHLPSVSSPGTSEYTDDPRRELAFPNAVESVRQQVGRPRIQRRRGATQLSLHAEESVAGKLTWNSRGVSTPSSWPDQLFRENFWDGGPISFVIDGVGVVALGAPGRFEWKVSWNSN